MVPMLTHDNEGLAPGEIRALLRLAVDPEARPQDRAWARGRLAGARLSYDNLGLAVKSLSAKDRSLRAELQHLVLELVSAA